MYSDGITPIRIVGDWRHSPDYWNMEKIGIKFSDNLEMASTEAFAHMFEGLFEADRRDSLEKYFPNAYDRFYELVGY